MALRLIEVTDNKTCSNIPIRYCDTQDSLHTQNFKCGDPTYGTFMSNGEDARVYNGPAPRTLIGAAAITAKNVLSSPVDQWNNFKVPRLDEDFLAVNASSETWMPVQNC